MVKTRNWDHAAGVLWPVLAKAAHERRTLFYSELSPLIRTIPLNVGRGLGPIQDYCLDHELPPLTAIVIGKISKVPGGGFIAWDIADLQHALKTVFDWDWQKVENPYLPFGPQISRASLARKLLKTPTSGGDIYRLVKDRGIAQRIFRLALLDAYRGACSFCGTSFTAALEAAHIIPWQYCTSEQKLDVRNGFLLCATHHRLFDKAYVSITSDYRIEYYDPDERDGTYSKTDRTLSTRLHGKPIYLPVDANIWPDPTLIRKRRKADGWPERTA